MALPYGIYQGSDAPFALAAPLRFKDLCRAIGREDLIEDERFNRADRLIANRRELDRELQAVFGTRPAAEWLRILEEADIPCGPVNRMDQALEDPQVRATRMVVSVPHALGGEVRVVGDPLRLSETPEAVRNCYWSPPPLGHHTDEILGGILGYSSQRLQELRAQEVIA